MTPFTACLRLLPFLLALVAAPVFAQPQSVEVTSLADSGPGTLREAVLDASPGAVITFASGLAGTLTLASEIVLDKDLTITGPGVSALALSGGGATRLFTVAAGADVVASGLTLQDGYAEGGGAVRNEGTFTFTDGAMTGNFGVQGGGAYQGIDGTLHLERVVLSGNEASGPGGALAMYSGTSTLINCTIYGNVIGANGLAGSGGGIANISGTLIVTSSTIAGNEVLGTGEGGGIRTSAFQTVTTLTGTLVSGNTAGTDPDVSGDYTQTSSLIGDAATGLGTFGDHGGPIPTLALLTGSSAIDAIPAAECPTDEDARGTQRPLDGDGDGEAACDIGAFERALDPAPVVTTLADSGPGSLRQAMADVAPGGEITFAPDVTGTVALAYELLIDRPVTIVGPGAGRLALTVTSLAPILVLTPEANVSLSGLTLREGRGNNGGAINNRGTLTFTDGVLRDNAAAGNGGAISTSGALTLERVALHDNTASGRGGGALHIGGAGSATLVNTTIYGNRAGEGNPTTQYPAQGGGVWVASGGTLSATSSTIVANTAVMDATGMGEGGGVYVDASGTATFTATLVADNTATTGTDVEGAYTQTQSLIGDAATGLGDLSDHGGPVPTLALLTGSSAIDAIPTADCPTEADARGELRGSDGNGDYVDGCDVGAFEADATPAFAVAASDSLYEDRVVLTWPVVTLPQSTLLIQRDATTIAIAAASDTTHTDLAAVGGETHTYCVTVVNPDDTEIELGCDTGNRALLAPRLRDESDNLASDGLVTTGTILAWRDRSNVETGYVVTRDGEDLFTTAANRSTFQDTTGVPDQVYAYCVAAVDATGHRSGTLCDDGSRAALLPARRVAATDGRFPDAVHVTFQRAIGADSLTTTGYRVERDGDLLETLPFTTPGDTLRYIDHPDSAPGTVYTYCVIAYFNEGGNEGGAPVISAPVCNDGFEDALPGPTEVDASDSTYDDHVRVTWRAPHIGDEPVDIDGYVLYRRAASESDYAAPLDTLGAAKTEYEDFSAVGGQAYVYGLAAFTEDGSKSDIGDPQEDDGLRSHVIGPYNLTASDGTHEAHVALAWESTSTSTLLFKVYRDSVLVATVPEWRFDYEDSAIVSDTAYTYGVKAVTFVDGSASRRSSQGRSGVARREADLRTALHDVFVRAEQAGARRTAAAAREGRAEPPSPYADATLIAQVQEVVTQNAGVDGIVESEADEDAGHRSLKAPSAVTATRGETEEERWVELTWTDNSEVEDSLLVYRRLTTEGPAANVYIGGVRQNTTSFWDRTGASGVRYTYSVRANDARGPGGFSVPSTAEGRRTLKAPSRLTATTDAFEDRVDLSWQDDSRAETGYLIFRDGTELGTAPEQAQTYTDLLAQTGGTFGESYTYTVRAFDDHAESVADTVMGGTVLLAPGSVSASTDYTDHVIVAWVDRSARETGYQVYRNTTLLTPTPLAAGATTYLDASPLASATYCVETVNGAMTSERDCATGAAAPADTGPDPVVLDLNEVLTPRGGPNSNYGTGDGFGTDVDISRDYLVVGTTPEELQANRKVMVYKRTGDQWEMQSSLFNGDLLFGAAGDAVAIDGDWVFYGDTLQRAGNYQQKGAVFAYQREGTDWVYREELVIDEDDQTETHFGRALDVDQDLLVVTNWSANGNAGQAVVFEFDDGQWGTWKASLPRFINSAHYGRSVAISGHTILVGDVGRAWLYTYDPDTELATLRARLVPDVSSSGFGTSVALHDGVALVGDPTAGSGKVHVFEGSGDTWSTTCSGSGVSRVCEPEQTLTVAGAASNARFGKSVAVVGDLAVVGAPNARTGSMVTGAAFQFERGETEWTYFGRVAHSGFEDGPAAEGNAFGHAVALSEDYALLGAPGYNEDEGAAFILPSLKAPTALTASDGTFDDRIQVRWNDETPHEDGFKILRRDGDGTFAEVGEVGANVEVFNDFDAPPGGLYAYRVVAFSDALTNYGTASSDEDLGWLPADGVISGRVAAGAGAGIEGVDVCLTPSQNRALLLDGEGGRAVRQNLQFSEELVVTYSVEFWVRGTGRAGLFSYAVGEEANALTVYDTGNQIEAYILGEQVVVHESTVLDGAWHHIALTMEPTGSFFGGLLRFYVDGEVSGSFETITLMGAGGVLMLGQEQDAVGGGLDPTQALDGMIDEVRIWDHMRAQAEIQADMNRRLRGDEEGLTAYWPFDQGAGRAGLDPSAGAQHMSLVEGAHWADEGAPIDVCAQTNDDGNYSIAGIRYDGVESFRVGPVNESRTYTPAFVEPSLNQQSPIENNVNFADVTSVTVAGRVVFPHEGGTCPAEGIELYLDDELQGATESDGTFALAVDPTDGPVRLEAVAGDHVFEPPFRDLVITEDVAGLRFEDLATATLSGFAGGSCDQTVGTLTVHIYTPDGCYDKTTEMSASYALDLPPQEYLVEVTNVVLAEGSTLSRVDVLSFYEGLGTRRVDLSAGDATLDFLYRAPLQVAFEGVPEVPGCGLGVPVLDGSTPTRYPLTIKVGERYTETEICPVDSGTVTIYDEWSDREGTPITLDVVDGEAEYDAFVKVPYVLEGRIVDGVDRSYQKALTVVAEAEGRNRVKTEWAVITGTRPRIGTFVTAPSNVTPMFVLHDPPGDGSYSYLEAGSTTCTGISFESATLVGVDSGSEVALGVQLTTGTSAGILVASDTQVSTGFNFELRLQGGPVNGTDMAVCATANEEFATSDAAEFIGPSADVFVGAGMNYLFAEADKLMINGNTCEVDLTTVLGVGIDEEEPFDTHYNYTRRFITGQLLPQLAELDTLYMATGDTKNAMIARNAGDVWRQMLKNDSTYQAEDAELVQNHSFSAGSSTGSSWTYDRHEGTDHGFTIDQELYLGQMFEADIAGNGSTVRVGFRENFSSTTTFPTDVDTTTTFGYVLDDDDSGDFFSVDVKRAVQAPPGEPNTSATYYPGGEMIFDLRAGTSSYPWEPGTQQRDRPVLSVNPSEQFGVPLDEAALFTLSLGNLSDSEEAREYVLATLPSTNPGGAEVMLGGNIQPQTFFIEEGTAISVPMQVRRGPTAFEYDRLGVMLYAESDYIIWQNGGIRPRADTAYVDVEFSTGCSPIEVFLPQDDWTINRATFPDSLDVLLHAFSTDSTDTGVRPTKIGLAYRPIVGAGRTSAGGLAEGGVAGNGSGRSTRLLDADATADAFSTGAVAPALARGEAAPEALTAPPRADGEGASGDVKGASSGDAARDNWTIVSDWGVFKFDGWTDRGANSDDPFTEYGERWAFPDVDGPYEIAGVVECSSASGSFVGRTFSDPVPGRVDTRRPRVLGTPAPADGLLTPGDDLTVTFDETMDPASFDTTGVERTVSLRPVHVGVGTADSLGAEVPVTLTSNGTSLVIEPEAGWAGLAGRYEAAVDSVRDVLGNALNAQPAEGEDAGSTRRAWRFTVRQGFAWAADSLAFAAPAGDALAFEADLVNGSPTAAAFTLTGLPGWLSATPTSGTIPPDGALAIAFTGVAPAAAGDYAADLVATSGAGTTTLPLGLTVADPACVPPTWGVNPAAFAYSMDATAEVYLGEETTPTDLEGVRVAAFVGGELRGVSPATVDEGLAHPLAYLSVYSNVEAGDPLTFRVFDPAACAVASGYTLRDGGAPVLAFEADRTAGSPADPAELRPSGTDLFVSLAGGSGAPDSKGYTWFSTNREGPTDLDTVLDGVGSSATDVITGFGGYAQYTPGAGWMGPLMEVVPGKSYHLALTDPAVLTFAGNPVPATMPIPIAVDWNWIGYHPDIALPINEALGGFAASTDDLVKGPAGYAQYMAGVGWLGSLETMEPGHGYRLHAAVAGTLVYPGTPPARIASAAMAIPAGAGRHDRAVPTRQASLAGGLAAVKGSNGSAIGESALGRSTTGGPAGDACARETVATTYPYSMVVTASVQSQALPSHPEGLTLSVTDAQGECRGRGRLEYVEALGRPLVFLMIHGRASGEDLQLRAYDAETGERYDGLQVALQEAHDPEPSQAPPMVERPLQENHPASRAPSDPQARTLPQARNPQARTDPQARSQTFGAAKAARPTQPEPGFSPPELMERMQAPQAPPSSTLAFEPDAVYGSPASPIVISIGDPAGGFEGARAAAEMEGEAEAAGRGATEEGSDEEIAQGEDRAGDGSDVDSNDDASGGMAEDSPEDEAAPTGDDVAGSIEIADAGVPDAFELAGAYPNPFSQTTVLSYSLPEAVHVRLVVYDLLGREVAVLVDGERAAGRYRVRFDAGRLPSGVYVGVLTAGDSLQAQRMLLAR